MNQTLCRRIVRERSGGACEIRNLVVCEGQATNCSHRKPVSQGGEWTPANILDACGSGTTGCHGWVEGNPAIAQAYGFRVWRNADPLTEPVLHGAQGRVLLDDAGGFTHVPFIRDATYSEPEGWATRAMYADDTVPHQIRLTIIGSEHVLTCTCGDYTRTLHGTSEIGYAGDIYRQEHLPAVPDQREHA